MRNTVTIDGVSSADVGLHFDKLPYIPAAKRRSNVYQIPGAGEDMTIHSDDYDDIPLTLTAYMRPGTDHQAAYNWAHGKQIVLSTQPTIYGIIKAVGEIAPSRVGWDAHKFDIPFTLSPFKYRRANEPVLLTSAGQVKTDGSVYSLPVYHLAGCAGDVVLTVNGISLTITDAPQDVYIDTVSQTVYTITDGAKVNIMQTTSGRFWAMVLVPGTPENYVSWEGTVGSVEITKNERWV